MGIPRESFRDVDAAPVASASTGMLLVAEVGFDESGIPFDSDEGVTDFVVDAPSTFSLAEVEELESTPCSIVLIGWVISELVEGNLVFETSGDPSE